MHSAPKPLARARTAAALLLTLAFLLPPTAVFAQSGSPDNAANASADDQATDPAAPFPGAGGIVIADGTTPPTPAAPYPYPIQVSGLTGNVSKVTLTISGFSHGFPDDVDMMLVAPNGAKLVLWSDVGGSTAASNVTVTLDDAAAAPVPDAGPLTSGTYKPTNVDTTDAFRAPAPAPAHPADDAAPGGRATFASKFTGLTPAQANGTWNFYVVDDDAGASGSIAGVTLNITQSTVPLAAGSLLISEFRYRGTGGATDEYVEIYNNTDEPLTVADTAGGSGFGIFATGSLTPYCVIPSGTDIPARGHFLCAGSAYSLSNHGGTNVAAPNAAGNFDLPDNAGLALYSSTTIPLFTTTFAGIRLDSAGPFSVTDGRFREGSGFRAITASNSQYALVRKLTTGRPQDTDNNDTDFWVVDANGNTMCTSTANFQCQRLGAPGPENLSSPIVRTRSIPSSLIDPCVSASSPPNRVRDTTAGDPSTSLLGTLSIRRNFTNNTGEPITRLRFRLVDVTTFPAPTGTADLRAITSNQVAVSFNSACVGGITDVHGTTLEEPPAQSIGGGFNSTLSAGVINTATPLAPGASISLQFLLGVQQTGSFRFFVTVEAMP